MRRVMILVGFKLKYGIWFMIYIYIYIYIILLFDHWKRIAAKLLPFWHTNHSKRTVMRRVMTLFGFILYIIRLYYLISYYSTTCVGKTGDHDFVASRNLSFLWYVNSDFVSHAATRYMHVTATCATFLLHLNDNLLARSVHAVRAANTRAVRHLPAHCA